MKPMMHDDLLELLEERRPRRKRERRRSSGGWLKLAPAEYEDYEDLYTEFEDTPRSKARQPETDHSFENDRDRRRYDRWKRRRYPED